MSLHINLVAASILFSVAQRLFAPLQIIYGKVGKLAHSLYLCPIRPNKLGNL